MICSKLSVQQPDRDIQKDQQAVRIRDHDLGKAGEALDRGVEQRVETRNCENAGRGGQRVQYELSKLRQGRRVSVFAGLFLNGQNAEQMLYEALSRNSLTFFESCSSSSFDSSGRCSSLSMKAVSVSRFRSVTHSKPAPSPACPAADRFIRRESSRFLL